MGIKLIAADLDGTLMYTDHMTVTPRTYNALKAAHDRGVHLAIATGRPRSLVGYVIEQLPFADYIISANGASAYSVKEKKNVYSDLIDNGTAVRVINRFLQEPVFFQAYCDGHAHYQADREPFFDYDDFPSDFIAQAQLHMTEYPDLCAGLGGRDIEMLAFYSLKRDMLPVYQELLAGYGLTVTNSFEGNIDVTSPTADKGSSAFLQATRRLSATRATTSQCSGRRAIPSLWKTPCRSARRRQNMSRFQTRRTALQKRLRISA